MLFVLGDLALSIGTFDLNSRVIDVVLSTDGLGSSETGFSIGGVQVNGQDVSGSGGKAPDVEVVDHGHSFAFFQLLVDLVDVDFIGGAFHEDADALTDDGGGGEEDDNRENESTDGISNHVLRTHVDNNSSKYDSNTLDKISNNMDVGSSLVDIFNISSKSLRAFVHLFDTVSWVEFSVSVVMKFSTIGWIVNWFDVNWFDVFFLGFASMWGVEVAISVVVHSSFFSFRSAVVSVSFTVSMAAAVSTVAEFSGSFWSIVEHVAHEKIADESKNSSDEHNFSFNWWFVDSSENGFVYKP